MMRQRRKLHAIPLAILLLSSFASSSSPQDKNSPIVARKEPAVDAPLYALDTKSTRPDVGTKDAPVDGLDGKPHAGPFVDPLDPLWHPPESNRKVKSSDNLRVSHDGKPSAEDGVMNDPNRLPPKKGTTGTEGGVTEKDRDRAYHESTTGEKMLQTPGSPKKATLAVDGQGKSDTDSKNAKDTEKPGKSESDGIGGLEKPADLPDKPYNIPHPEPAVKVDNKFGIASKSRFSDDDDDDDDDHDDDDDDDYEEQDGIHDIIPWDSLAGSFSSIAATEIGDKTFIVAALMAMRYSRLQVFSAAFAALFIMTILSGLAGHILGAIISKRWSALVAALLFLVFGAKSLREGFAMSPNQGVSDEIREVEAELEEKEVDMARHANGGRRTSAISPYALEAGRANGRKSRSRTRMGGPRRDLSESSSRSPSPPRPTIQRTLAGVKNLFSLLLSPAWVETFSMTFVGELGDRSQIATVAMAAGQEYFWVMVGASLGHFVCTGVAVVGGSVLAGRVSLRIVTLIGGAIFIAFGIFTLIEAAQYWT